MKVSVSSVEKIVGPLFIEHFFNHKANVVNTSVFNNIITVAHKDNVLEIRTEENMLKLYNTKSDMSNYDKIIPIQETLAKRIGAYEIIMNNVWHGGFVLEREGYEKQDRTTYHKLISTL